MYALACSAARRSDCDERTRLLCLLAAGAQCVSRLKTGCRLPVTAFRSSPFAIRSSPEVYSSSDGMSFEIVACRWETLDFVQVSTCGKSTWL